MAHAPPDALTSRYDREARAYRELWAPILRTAGLLLLEQLGGEPVRRVVDVGSGVGTLLPYLATAFPGAAVIGVDRSRGMIALVPRSFDRAVMDAQRLAIASGSVDRVSMAFMLFHLDSPIAGLRESRRVLRDGGRLGTVTWGAELDSAASRVWAECLNAHGALSPEPDAQARHELVDTPEKVEALLYEAGFSSARSWAEDLVHTIDAELLISLRTSLGVSKRRFDSLAPGAQEACAADARRQMRSLSPEDFVARGRVIYAVARA